MGSRSIRRIIQGVTTALFLFGALHACVALTDLEGFTSVSGDAMTDGAAIGDATSVGSDGGADAPIAMDAGDAAMGSFCQRQSSTPILCEDFEGANPLGGWDVVLAGDASAVALAPGVGPDGSRALRSAILPGPVQPRYAAWRRQIAAAPAHFRYSYALHVEEPPTAGQYEVGVIPFNAGSTGFLYLAVRTGGAANDGIGDQQGRDNIEHPLTLRVPIKAWFRIAFEVTFTAGGGTLLVTFDGRTALETPIAHFRSGSLEVQAGISYAYNDETSGKVLVDDILVEQLP